MEDESLLPDPEGATRFWEMVNRFRLALIEELSVLPPGSLTRDLDRALAETRFQLVGELNSIRLRTLILLRRIAPSEQNDGAATHLGAADHSPGWQ
jgi:hypothetical protein